MKRLYSFILACVIIVLCIVPISVGAVDYNTLDYTQAIWKPSTNLSNVGTHYNGTYTFSFHDSTNFEYTGMELTVETSKITLSLKHRYGSKKMYWNLNGESNKFDYDTSNTFLPEYVIMNEDVTDTKARFIIRYLFTYNEPLCDGTECVQIDLDMNNVCDTCGYTFSVLREYSPPDPYLVWTEDRQELFPYAFVYYDSTNSPRLVLTKVEPYYALPNVVVPKASSGTSCSEYSVWDNGWRLVSSYETEKTFNTMQVIPSFNMFDDSGIIKYYHDTDFFPIPLWVEIQGITADNLPTTLMEMGGTMKILTVCSVGCLALLLGLSICIKVFRTYRSQYMKG